MPLIWLIVVGVAAGFLATRLLKVDLDTPSTIALGVLGALVGGLVLRGLTMLVGFGAGVVAALLGAILLVWAWKTWIR
jgi:uncharacterized membrane protein YeaQ/YmgE (transglycosylase-associated protein family)